MDVGTHIKPLMPGRQEATGLRWSFAAAHVSRHHEIFKKTPFVSGLHPVSRDVVKDIAEIAGIPLLATTTLDQDAPQGLALAGLTTAENPTAVTPYSHQSVLRSADKRTAGLGDVVGVKGNQAIDESFTVGAFDAGISNGKLTHHEWDARTSNWASCAINTGTGLHTNFALQDRFVTAGASLSGGDLENHCYADI